MVEKEEKWREEEYRTCDRCGRSISAKEVVGKCIDPDCKRFICEICHRGYCSICDGVLCKDHAYYDKETDKVYCKAHIPTEKCEICGRERIAKTLIKGEKEIPREILGNCKECGKLICNDCGHLCAECRGIVCKNCAHYDEKTDKYYCKEHIPKAGGCFIATAAYGTPFEPKIDVFRDFRDEVLVRYRLGRGFISLYYSLSPPIANVISKHEWMRCIIREMILEPLLKILSKNKYK